MTTTLNRLFTSAALLVLPSVDNILDGIQTLLVKLDGLTQRIERDLENRVVVLAQNAANRRLALEAVMKVYDDADAKQLAIIDSHREKLDKAAGARDRVADALGL